jgi:hypothetical protein
MVLNVARVSHPVAPACHALVDAGSEYVGGARLKSLGNYPRKKKESFWASVNKEVFLPKIHHSIHPINNPSTHPSIHLLLYVSRINNDKNKSKQGNMNDE